jgi:hypothetical protein
MDTDTATGIGPIGMTITATTDAVTAMITVTTVAGMVAIDNRSAAASDRP